MEEITCLLFLSFPSSSLVSVIEDEEGKDRMVRNETPNVAFISFISPSKKILL